MNRQPYEQPNVPAHLWAGAVAGIVGAAVYAVEQEIDLRAFDSNTDDLILLGGLLTQDPHLARATGLVMHLSNGAIAGAGYALLAHNRLPGPPIVRGMTFAVIETAALYPLAMFEDHHPAIHHGLLARYWNRTAFAQALLRHLVFGAVLGPLTARLLRS